MKKSFVFAAGIILGTTLSVGGIAFADTSINVSFNPLKIFVNGVDKTPANNQFNNNGAVVPAELIYNGTTYVPLRMASNLLGTPITYDGSNQAIRLGIDPTQGAYLSDSKPYAVSDGYTAALSNNDRNSIVGDSFHYDNNYKMKMAGSDYAKGVGIFNSGMSGNTHKVFYNLNGKYSSLSALLGVDDTSESGSDKTVTIFADDKQVWSHDFKTGDLPQAINLPLTSVLQLRIEIEDNNYRNAIIDIVNPVLK